MKYLYILFLVPLLCLSCGDEDIPGSNDNNGQEEVETMNWTKAAATSTNALTTLFWNPQSYYFNYDNYGKTDWHYWPQAHGLDVWVDAYLRSGENYYLRHFEQWFDGVKSKNGNTWQNDYYDDMEWIALALLRTYQVTNEPKYKDATLQIWDYIKGGWDNNGGGGITWKKGNTTKNACSNGPACILAARLYQEFGDEENKEWALRIYNWQTNTLVNTTNGAVYDHIDYQTGAIQTNWIFTYNQGTFTGSAVELYKITGDKMYLNDAILFVNYSLSYLVTNAVLKSEGDGDGGLFKGIFIRYFTDLIRQEGLETANQQRYIQFMKYNAETLWNEGTTQSAILFGSNWQQQPGNTTGLTEQLSGCMLVEAMALLEKEGYLD